MACQTLGIFCRLRRGAVAMVLAFSLAACGGGSTSSDPPLQSGPSDVPPSSGALAISGSPSDHVVAGQTYSFVPAATGSAGGTLTFAVANLPAWASFDSRTGRLTGTPTSASVGTFASIKISVSDGQTTATLPAFSITVLARLKISGTPPTHLVAGSYYAFLPTTNAEPGATLTFSVRNKPPWASFNASTGELSGTPAQAGTYGGIAIDVSDGIQSSALAAFSISVSAQTKGGVTISGHPPASVNAGSAYSFTPTASGPSGSPLKFTIQNKPSWASFSAANGALTGTPGAANVGTYSNILISVTGDGTSASLPAFTISVNQVSNGTASLSWTPVDKNTNGTVLANLAGYRVHYGTSPTAMNTVITLANPSLTNYLVTNLSSGTWYFGISAYTSNGRQSAMSNVGHKTIP